MRDLLAGVYDDVILVDPGDALAGLLLTAGVPAAQIRPGPEARIALWRDRLADKRLLLILDDAASRR